MISITDTDINFLPALTSISHTLKALQFLPVLCCFQRFNAFALAFAFAEMHLQAILLFRTTVHYYSLVLQLAQEV